MTAQHTPEPWFIDEFGDVRTSLDCYGNLIDMNLRHNKTRIVACVNACAGKTNEQLEGAAGKLFTGSAIALWSNYCDLKEKNAALSEQVAGLVGAVDIWQENPTTGNGFALIDAAAIAKAGSHE